jgi:hypothetical protein
MAWYNPNVVPEWKQLISKPFTFETLLTSKDALLKEIRLETEVQNYVLAHKEAIIEEGLRLCLNYPAQEAPYDRKYSLPTRAIDLLTNL